MKRTLLILLGATLLHANVEAQETTELYNFDFESITTGWTGRGAAQIATSTDCAKSGTSSLKISGRTAVWNGASFSAGDIISGKNYIVSCAFTFSNEEYDSHVFELCAEYNDGTNTQYITIASANVTRGKWTEVSGEISFPAGSSNIALYVQSQYTSSATDKDLMDFYIDDFVCIGEELPEVKSLSALYEPYFYFGTAVSASVLNTTAGKSHIEKHFNSLTAENEMKPDATLNQALSKQNGSPVVQLSSGAKAILQYCSDNNIPLRGHCLVWHSQTPAWFFHEDFDTQKAIVSKETMTTRMEQYIKAMFELLASSYPNVNIYAYDVVNEAFTDGGGELRKAGTNPSSGESYWTKIYGDDTFIVKAFEFARKYAPSTCKLYYNDFNEYIPAKRDAIYNLVKKLYNNGTCDGVGMQSHLSTTYPSVQLYEEALSKFASIGCDVQVTELDITIESGTTAATQAKIYSDLYDIYIEHSAHVSSVSVWGLHDGMSWRRDRKPLLFNSDYSAKSAYYAIIDGLSEANAINDNRMPREASDVVVFGVENAFVIDALSNGQIEVYNLNGLLVGRYRYNEGQNFIPLSKGIYIANRQKFVVR